MRLRAIFYASLLLPSLSAAEDFCSLRVTVRDPSGHPVGRIVVAIEEEDGSGVSQVAETGTTQFCGLGIRPVSVRIGDAGCSQVLVRAVPLNWGVTTNLWVGYDASNCGGGSLPVAACAILLRFTDAEGTPVPGVSFEAHRPFRKAFDGDRFGRILVRIAGGQEISGEASARGYAPAKVAIPCTSQNYRSEVKVKLLKK